MKLPVVTLLAFSSLVAWAQPAARPDTQEAWLSGLSTEFSWSSREAIEHASAPGEVGVNRFKLATEGRVALPDDATLAVGLDYTLLSIDATSSVFVPERLSEVAVRLNYLRALTPQWRLSVMASPGLYGDLADIDGKTFNVPLMVGATYAASRDLVWLFGLRADLYSERPVLPLVGVRWQFAPEWSLSLAFPRTGVTWRWSEQVSLDAGLSFQGGTYRITENLGVPHPGSGRLANTFVDYREIRVGTGAEWALGEGWTLRAEAGVMTDRKFDYFDRDYTVNSASGVYTTLGLRARF